MFHERSTSISEQLFRELIEAMPQMVFVTRPDGGNLFQNRRWSEYTGLSQEGAGERWADTVHPEDLDRTRAAWKGSLATGRMFSIEHRLRDAAGQYRWFLTRAVALRDQESKNVSGWIGASTDISEIVAAHQTLSQSRDDLKRQVASRTRELQEARERLAHAQHMEALGQLAGGIAHDFNNILQSVMGGAATIKRRAGDAEKVISLARMISEAAARGAAITRRLLAFARQDNLKAEPVCAESLLAGIQEILNHTLGAGIVVKLDVAPDLPALLSDRPQLETALINLAKNASDAMHGSGTVRLSAITKTICADEPPGCPAALAVGPYVRLSVSDTGIGIKPELLSRVTEPFFTTKEVGKGTGLGLSMVRGFAEQSGGALHIESAPDAAQL